METEKLENLGNFPSNIQFSKIESIKVHTPVY